MAYTPRHYIRTTTETIFRAGGSGIPVTARDLGDTLRAVQAWAERADIDTSFDDWYTVKGFEDGSIEIVAGSRRVVETPYTEPF